MSATRWPLCGAPELWLATGNRLSSLGSAVVTSDRRTFIQQAGVGLATAGLTAAATGKAGGI